MKMVCCIILINKSQMSQYLVNNQPNILKNQTTRPSKKQDRSLQNTIFDKSSRLKTFLSKVKLLSYKMMMTLISSSKSSIKFKTTRSIRLAE